ncbi:MAG TPA: sugar transferase [Candidatus Paceibacterota bacterium]|nr:sugar transferase [Candidatus Paceibacterota bacterium]
MSIVPKRDPFVLLAGDIVTFVVALWLTLTIRALAFPSFDLFLEHLEPFAILFVGWAFVFLLAGLYDRTTRLLRARLPETILYAQTINIALAALFFFFVPGFGIAPKTVLAIYLVVSSGLIFLWRVYLFRWYFAHARQPAVLLGSGSAVEELVAEVNDNPHYPFIFTQVIDTDAAPMAEVVQQLCRIIEEKREASIIVADTTSPLMSAILPIVYDVAFSAPQFAFIDLALLYEDVFEKVPLAHLRYDWVLSNVGRSTTYDALKRALDIILGIIGCLVLSVLYPFIALAIKLEDGGSAFIAQERIGRYGKTIRILKFRSMTGNDDGKYEGGKSNLVVTKVGRILRKTHLDEFPQFISLLGGDISFVGPRPELPALAAQYAAKIPFYNARHLIAPGLTGWARLRHRGDPHHGTDIAETKQKLAYDLYYMKHRSILLDIHIIFQTVKLLVGAQGKA